MLLLTSGLRGSTPRLTGHIAIQRRQSYFACQVAWEPVAWGPERALSPQQHAAIDVQIMAGDKAAVVAGEK
jgi:hypothetical protein